jgi:hypothetical protein
MKKYLINKTSKIMLIALILGVSSCKKDFTNPGAATSASVLNSVNGLTGVAIGLQNWYSAGRGGLVYNTITASGLLTGEFYVVNSGNTDEAQLGTGGSTVLNTNGIGIGMWSVGNKIIYDANNIIANVGIVGDKGYASGLVAYASIFKALALADMATFWDHIPDTVGNNVNYVTSAVGYARAIAALDYGLNAVAANPISATFQANVNSGVSIVNTLYALKARYSLYLGNYAAALAAANNVNLTVKSVFNYSTVTLNPIFSVATSTNNVFQPVDSTMGLPAGLLPDPNDKREPFYIAISASPRFRISGFGAGTTTGIPVYLPGEIMLIKAECYAQQNDLINGLIQLNNVVTKTPAADLFGVGAALPPTTTTSQADLVTQIYKHRCIELFMSGLKLADQKRLNRPTTERKRSFLPYPFAERNGNTNTPPDPPF